MPSNLTPKMLEGIRAAQRNAPTTGGQKINLVTSETLGLLLDAAEAMLHIRAIDKDFTCSCYAVFSKRVEAVLDEWERGT